MQKGIKFRIYPNREQKNFIHQTLGCCRLIYNRGLAMRKGGYENGEKIGYSQTSAMLTELKKQEEFAFLKAVSYTHLDVYKRQRKSSRLSQVSTVWCSLILWRWNLVTGVQTCALPISQTSAMLTELKRQEEFAFLKAADSIALQQSLRDLDQSFVNFFQKRASYPTFKSKHNRFQSYRTVNQKDNIRIVGRYIKLPKLGFVKIIIVHFLLKRCILFRIYDDKKSVNS